MTEVPGGGKKPTGEVGDWGRLQTSPIGPVRTTTKIWHAMRIWDGEKEEGRQGGSHDEGERAAGGYGDRRCALRENRLFGADQPIRSPGLGTALSGVFLGMHQSHSNGAGS